MEDQKKGQTAPTETLLDEEKMDYIKAVVRSLVPTTSELHSGANTGTPYQKLTRPYMTLPKTRNQTTKETFVTKLIDYV